LAPPTARTSRNRACAAVAAGRLPTGSSGCIRWRITPAARRRRAARDRAEPGG
jgi:hypothetical protein